MAEVADMPELAWLAEPSQVAGPLQALIICRRMVVMRRRARVCDLTIPSGIIDLQAHRPPSGRLLGEPPQVVAGHLQATMLCRSTGLSQDALTQRFERCPRNCSRGYCCTVDTPASTRDIASSGNRAPAGSEDLQTHGDQRGPCRACTLSIHTRSWQGTSRDYWLSVPCSKGWNGLCQAWRPSQGLSLVARAGQSSTW